jgi:MFS family permease
LTPALVAKIDRSRTDSQRIDFLGGVLVTCSLLALVYSVGNANNAPLNQTLIGLAVAVVLLIVFLILEANLRSPMLPLGIFRLPTLVLANIVGFTCYAGLTCVVFISTLYMQNALGYTPFAAGMSLLPMSIAAAVVSNLSPLLMNRIGLRPTMVTGMLLTTVGCALASWLMAVNSTFWVVVIPTVIVGSGLSLAFPAVMVAAMAGTPLSDQGFASGLISTSGQLGGAIGLALAIYIAAVFTPVVSATHTAQDVNQALVDGFHAALWLTTAYAFLGSLLVLVGFRNRAAQPAKQESSTSAPAEV